MTNLILKVRFELKIVIMKKVRKKGRTMDAREIKFNKLNLGFP